MNRENQLKPGRLSITCINAKNIRARVAPAADSKSLTPHLFFKLNGFAKSSRTGKQRGHDLIFSNEVVSFDLSQPDDVELVIELCDDSSNESVGRATFSIANVLKSGVESAETLEIIKPGDSTTNSTVSLKFAFVQGKHGVIKLNLNGATDAMGGSKDMYAMISTPDGQSRKAALADADTALGFYVDPSNWFGDFAVQLYKGSECIGSGKLSLLSCLNGSEIKSDASYVPIVTNDDQAPVVAINHWFLEAGFVQIQSISASNLRDVSIDSTGLKDPRVIVRTFGKTHSTAVMTNAAVRAEPNVDQWNDEICVPTVDEYSLVIECCEFDGISNDTEPIGSTEVSLLPLFKTGHLETSLDLTHETELGETLHSGKVHIVLSFDAPRGAAFPSDQPTMTSYILGQSDTIANTKKNVPMDVDDNTFTEEAIQRAFTMFDLDKNGYIGVSELKHILIMMGEHVSDEEVDMMISMLDLNGDGQVSFKEFKAMAESPDPSKEDFLKGGVPARTSESTAAQQRKEQADKKREAFSRCVKTCKMDKEDIFGMWKFVRQRVRSLSSKNISHESFYIGYDGVCELMPTAFVSATECRVIFDLLRVGEQVIDSRDLILTFTNFVSGFGLEEKCKLAFEMFDVDHSGYLSLDEIEAMMISTNLTTLELVKKRAENFMLCADTDRSGGITVDELVVAAEKLPNLLYPTQTKK